jgi:hypothetical protein
LLRICAYANNQHNLAGEIGSGAVEESSFYKALLRTAGTVAVIDAAGNYFTRLWCGYELHISVLARGDDYLFDAYTARKDAARKESREPDAVGLLDGFAAADTESRHGDSDAARNKARREAAFPLELIWRALDFKVQDATTSLPADRARIVAAIDDESSLNATVAAKFGVRAGQITLPALSLSRTPSLPPHLPLEAATFTCKIRKYNFHL